MIAQDRHDFGDPDIWLWRVTWHKGTAYSLGYGCGKDQSVWLNTSKDGKKFDTRQEYGDHGLWVRPKHMFEKTVEVDGK